MTDVRLWLKHSNSMREARVRNDHTQVVAPLNLGSVGRAGRSIAVGPVYKNLNQVYPGTPDEEQWEMKQEARLEVVTCSVGLMSI